MPAKSISIELGGRNHSFRFDFNALCALEDGYGISIGELGTVFGGKESRGVRLKDLRILVWAALLHENPLLTITEAGDMVDPGNMAKITEKVMEALVAAFPEAKEDEKNPERSKPKEKNGTSKSS